MAIDEGNSYCTVTALIGGIFSTGMGPIFKLKIMTTIAVPILRLTCNLHHITKSMSQSTCNGKRHPPFLSQITQFVALHCIHFSVITYTMVVA
jgi:hypothetical protein